MKTPTFALSGLQPGDRRRAQKKHTKTLNIDLSCSDRAPNGLVRSRRIAGGADQAAARVDKAFPMILTMVGMRSDWRRRSIASCEDRSARAVLKVRSGHPVPETWVATLAAALPPRCARPGPSGVCTAASVSIRKSLILILVRRSAQVESP